MTGNYAMIVVFCHDTGRLWWRWHARPLFGLSGERFPTEVRATASSFVYHQGAIFGGLTAPVITYFAISWQLGFAIPMAVGSILGCISVGVSCCSPASDCQITEYETDAGGRYWITAEGERIQVPPDKILQRADNPTGRGVACLRHDNGHPVVRCFVRASEG
jgi:hypothetical protein